MANTRQEFTVRASGQGYATNTVRGERASCTSSDAQAAQRMGQKLFGPALIDVAIVRRIDQFDMRWRAEADPEGWASCDSNGLVHFGPVIPPLNTGLARGPMRSLIAVLTLICTRVDPEGEGTLCRLLVPGVGLSTTREDKDHAITAFLAQYSRDNFRRGCLGVTFATAVVRAQL